MMTRGLKLVIEYDGTRYAGWQIQPNGVAVQQVIESALANVLGNPVRLRSSGRTDAGVHALGMVAMCTTNSTIPVRGIQASVNKLLPDDIVVQSISEIDREFNPIKEARRKQYQYTIYNGLIRSPLMRHFSWHVREKLDISAMRRASAFFVGEHDFGAFRASNSDAKTSVRTIMSVQIQAQNNIIQIDIVGSGFLKNMVRIMTGTLVDIGRGHYSPEHILALLENKDRKKAGVTAPACGLCLLRVDYDESIFPPTGS